MIGKKNLLGSEPRSLTPKADALPGKPLSCSTNYVGELWVMLLE